MHHVLRVDVFLALVLTVIVGCESQPPSGIPPAPAPGAPLSANTVPDQGNASVGIAVNASPQVDAMLSSTGHVASHSPVELQVTAHDPDRDPLRFAWTSTCPGTFDRADLDQVTFVTGILATGADCAFEVDVSDGRGGSAKGTLVLSAAVPVINIAPAMGVVWQSSDAADVAETVRLHASASDPEGQALAWTWKASGGVLSDQVDQAGSSELSWTAPATPGVRCTITATATDPQGASASFVFEVQVQTAGG